MNRAAVLIVFAVQYFASFCFFAQAQQTPIAAYGFDEGSGSIAVDRSGLGHHGTLSGPTRVAGRFGGALAFDGVDDLVLVSDTAALRLSTAMTVEAWIWTSSAPTRKQTLVDKAGSYFLAAALASASGPAVGGTFGSQTAAAQAVNPVPIGEWVHVAGTYDSSTLVLYRNGLLVASANRSSHLANSTSALRLGGTGAAGEAFQGLLDEVRLYNRVLTQAEIAADMNTPVNPTTDTMPPTVSVSSPRPAALVTAVVPLVAEASDDQGVAAVQFLVDNSASGSEVTAPPYTMNLNTALLTNGLHSLKALARDVSGNVGTSSPVSVMVSNAVADGHFQNEVMVGSGLDRPTVFEFLPDGRILIGEIEERILVVQPGASQPDPTPFLTINPQGLFGEQGLMDMKIDPDFAQNGYLYVFYTMGALNRNRVSRFTSVSNQVVSGSEVVLWQDIADGNFEHHGGSVTFGPDGKLYISTGDEFSEVAVSQQMTSYQGKILRINPDGTIPVDNPFYDGAGPNLDAIWATGLRNPFRCVWDLPTGRFFIGDVGGNDASESFEELNLGQVGANYGWPNCEGPCTGLGGVNRPIYTYPHGGRDACIVGGFVYRGSQFPAEYVGSYFFADYAQNWIKRLTFGTNGAVNGVFAFEPADGRPDGPYGEPVCLKEGPDGSLYYLDISFDGLFEAKLRRIRFIGNNRAPVVAASATPSEGLSPLAVAFSSFGSFDPEGLPLGYNWNFGDNTISTQANPSHTYTKAGQYAVQLTVSDGANSSASVPINILVGLPPVVTIEAPANGLRFKAGEGVLFQGHADDPETGVLPASKLSWTVVFHHATHIHPVTGPWSGTNQGTLVIPSAGHDFGADTSYELILTATDPDGLSASSSVFIYPDLVPLTLTTSPAGLLIKLDGITRPTPLSEDSIPGFHHVVEAPNATVGGTNLIFQSWSDGGAQSHDLIVPAAGVSLMADYRTIAPGTLAVASAAFVGADFRVQFSSTTGRLYRVEFSSQLVPAMWNTLADLIVGTGGLMEVPDPAPAASQRFYRVLQLPPASFGLPDFATAAESHGLSLSSVSTSLNAVGENRLLLAGICWYGGGRTITSVTYGGVACAQVMTTNWFYENGYLALYALAGPAAGSGTLRVTFSGVASEVSLVGMIVTNANQTSSVRAAAGRYGASATLGSSVAVPSVPEDLLVDVLCYPIFAPVPGPGQTQRIVSDTPNKASARMSTKRGAAGSTTMSWSTAGPSELSQIGVSIRAR